MRGCCNVRRVPRGTAGAVLVATVLVVAAWAVPRQTAWGQEGWSGSLAVATGEAACGPGSGDEPAYPGLVITQAWIETPPFALAGGSVLLGVGRRQTSWGPGMSGQLLLSGNAFADLAWCEWRSGPYRYIQLGGMRGAVGAGAGFPERPAYVPEVGAGRGGHPLYLLGHRLEWRPSDRLTLGIAETVAASGEEFRLSPLYLVPGVPFYLTQWLVAKQDRRQDNLTNVNLGLDAAWSPAPGVRLYGELLVDDAPGTRRAAELVPPFYGLLVGIGVDGSGTGLLATGSAWAEYVRISDFTYSHRNPNNDYLSFGRLMGHWLGPDADALIAAYQRQIAGHPGLDLCVGLEVSRHGEGDVGEPWKPEYGAAQPFPSGVVERRVGVWARAGRRLVRVGGGAGAGAPAWALGSTELVLDGSVCLVDNAGHLEGRRAVDAALSAALAFRF